MHVKEKKINKLFEYWLLISLTIVFFIIIVGGLTRLTNSGLSIIEWELLRGIIPPLDHETWNFYFDKYKTIPQYKLLNSNMKIDEFKIIFYWEYFHRILARFIGLFFFIPLILFYLSKCIDKHYIKISFVIFSLIVIQGIIGWFMVKSGLINDVTVSHYRLSLHLSIAIIIISTMFWLLKNIKNKKRKNFFVFSKKYLPFQILIILILFQIVMGAFVSGLDAGKIYQSWPLMGNTFFPNDMEINNVFDLMEFDNHSLVQFYHRLLAYIIILYVFFLTANIFKNKIKILIKPLLILLLVLSVQVFLGIFTLISDLNIYLASGHQITSVLLVFSAINLYYFIAK
tara:strand:- start:2259 stop:3284 length:1026 start_codon:yes stop_codon:yes gene_type:complete